MQLIVIWSGINTTREWGWVVVELPVHKELVNIDDSMGALIKVQNFIREPTLKSVPCCDSLPAPSA